MQSSRIIQSWWFPFVLISIFPVIWATWMMVNGFALSGDNAWIGLRTFDIFSTNPPLTGMPSTSGQDAPGVSAYHPGPFQFMLLAPFYAATAWSQIALAYASLALNLVMVAIGFWAAWKIDIPAAKFAAVSASSVVLLGEQFRMMYPWNPRPVELGMVALLALTWAILVGRQGCWPWLVFVTAVMAQSHILGLPIVWIALGVLAFLGWRFGSLSRPSKGELWISLTIFAVAWVLPVWDVLSNWPGNMGEILSYMTASKTAEKLPDPWQMFNLVARMFLYAVLSGFAFVRGRKMLSDPAQETETLRWGAGLIALGFFQVGLLLLTAVGGAGRLSYLDMISGATWMLLFLLLPRPVLWWSSRTRWTLVPVIFLAMNLLAEVPNFRHSMSEVADHREAVHAAREFIAKHESLPILIEQSGTYSWLNLYPAVILGLTTEGERIHYDPVGRPEQYDVQRRSDQVEGEHWVFVIADQSEASTPREVDGMLTDELVLNLQSSRYPVTYRLYRAQ